MAKVVTFGEIMGRIEPEGFLRFRQALPGRLKMTFAGAEANVAASICIMGGEAKFITALPKNTMADACIGVLRNIGVDTSGIVRKEEGRLGLFFVETGANQRPGNVIYDREGSTISTTRADEYNWKHIFQDIDWFHVTGITPAISQEAAQAALAALQSSKENSVMCSLDLNFRKKLWKWKSGILPRELAEKTIREMLHYVDLVMGNEEDMAVVFNIRAGKSDVEKGILDVERYQDVAKEIITQYRNIRMVAITLRESISASHNNWGGMLYDAASQKGFFAPIENNRYSPYLIRNIVDRIGCGDSFSAALIFALLDDELKDPEKAIAYAAAASCLCHSIPGDFNFSTKEEVLTLMSGIKSGRVKR